MLKHTAVVGHLRVTHGVWMVAWHRSRRLLHPGLTRNLGLSCQVQRDVVCRDDVQQEGGHDLSGIKSSKT